MNLHQLADTPPWDWPGDAANVLLAALRDTGAEPADRELAAELAGDTTVIDDTLAATLLEIVQDPTAPQELRGRAAIALGPALETEWEEEDWDDPEDKLLSPTMLRRARETLREVHRDGSAPRDVRRYALEASIRYPDEWHEDAVREAFRRDELPWTQTALFCASYLGGFDDRILEALTSDRDEVRFEALRAAGKRELEQAAPQILDVLRDPRADRDLLLIAIHAAGALGSDRLGEALGELAESEDEEIRDAADEALGMRAILDQLDEDEDDEEW